jgi:hypothetical protein
LTPLDHEQLALGEHQGPEETIERDFRKFDNAHPEVYAEIVRLARIWVERRGATRLGINVLYGVLRWNLTLERGEDGFKLNNNHQALYARKVMAHEPDLAGLFQLRGRSAACQCSRCVNGDEIERARRILGLDRGPLDRGPHAS